MTHPLVEKIMRDGLASINVSMLSKPVRSELLLLASRSLMNANRVREAADALALGECKDELRGQGEWLRSQGRLGAAALFLRHVETPQALGKLAQDCLGIGEVESARAIYEILGDEQMLSFLKENFTR